MQIEIHSYRDVGQVLRDMRLHLKLDPRDIGQQLHIRAKYLTALEEGNLEELPGKVYARGYLRQYAEFLGLNAEEIANAFDRVQSGERNVKYFVPEPTSRVYQPGLLVVLIAFAAVALVYIYWYHTHKQILPPDHEMVAPVPERLLAPVVPEEAPVEEAAPSEAPALSDVLEQHEAYTNPLAVEPTPEAGAEEAASPVAEVPAEPVAETPEAVATEAPAPVKPAAELPWRKEVKAGNAPENPVIQQQRAQ